MRILLILKICSAINVSPYIGTVGLTSWDRSETPVLEYRKRFAKRGPGLALFGGSDMILKRKYITLKFEVGTYSRCVHRIQPRRLIYQQFLEKVDRMCQRSSAIIALIACNQYCDNNPDCELPTVQFCFHSIHWLHKNLSRNSNREFKIQVMKTEKGNEDTKDELMKMTRVKYCSDNYDKEHAICMDAMGY